MVQPTGLSFILTPGLQNWGGSHSHTLPYQIRSRWKCRLYDFWLSQKTTDMGGPFCYKLRHEILLPLMTRITRFVQVPPLIPPLTRLISSSVAILATTITSITKEHCAFPFHFFFHFSHPVTVEKILLSE